LRATPLVTNLSKRYVLISEFGPTFGVHLKRAAELAPGDKLLRGFSLIKGLQKAGASHVSRHP
jgi:hypothetical protein